MTDHQAPADRLAHDRLTALREGLQADLRAVVGASPTMDGIGFGKRVGLLQVFPASSLVVSMPHQVLGLGPTL